MGRLRRRGEQTGTPGKKLTVALASVAAWALLLPGGALAVHFFPLFPGDPLGDCGQQLEEPPPESDATVIVSGNVFLDTDTVSSTTVVEVGDTVTWQWVGDHCHSVTSTGGPDSFTTWGGDFGFEPELVRPDGGDSFTVTFDEPGTYPYVCRHHQTIGMTGEVQVVGDGGGDGGDESPGKSGDAPGHDDDRERGNPDKELGKSEDAPGHQR